MSATPGQERLRVAIVGAAPRQDLELVVGALTRELESRGARMVGELASQADLVLNLASVDEPKSHWRREGLGQFGATLLACPLGSFHVPVEPAAVLRLVYPALLKTMSNAVVASDGESLCLVTPELGVRLLSRACAPSPAVLDALLPLAGARFCIDNEVAEDLPPELERSPAAAALAEGGRRLAALGLLPSPVALEDILSEEDRKLLRAIYGVQQISYGNLSCREPSGGFWMSGRGVDKGRLELVGRDLLLVTGHDEASGRLRISVPPGHADARVSVDAMEHALLYARWPEIGAIVHVHAWMEGVDSTHQNWPCGTVEIAEEVAELVGRQAEPHRAAVGLRNHGLTITGPSLDEIFSRIEGRLQREVPAT